MSYILDIYLLSKMKPATKDKKHMNAAMYQVKAM